MKTYLATLLSIGLFAAPAVNAADTVAYYQITFNATWSQLTHPHPGGPDAFPDEPRFSPLVGAIHNAGVSFWQEGGFATFPIEEIAENGNPSPFLSSLAGYVNAGTALGGLYAQEAPDGRMIAPGVLTIPRVRVSTQFPLITLLTMVGPSPDWIVGVSGQSLLDGEGDWYEELVVELYPYDGGTEDGIEYDLENPPTVPQQPITNITGVPPLSNLPLGTFVFERLPQMSSVVSLSYDFAWNTGESGNRTTTLFVDRTYYDDAGGSGSWRFSPTGPSLTLTSEGADNCGAVLSATLIGPTQFQANLSCSRMPQRAGIAAGTLVRP